MTIGGVFLKSLDLGVPQESWLSLKSRVGAFGRGKLRKRNCKGVREEMGNENHPPKELEICKDFLKSWINPDTSQTT